MGSRLGQIRSKEILFTSNYQPENRKPRGKGAMTKFREEFKVLEVPLSNKEAEFISRVLLSKTKAELEEMRDDPNTPSGTLGYICGVLEDIKTGKTWTIDKLMDRSFGTVTHKTEEISKGKIKFIKTEGGGIRMITEHEDDGGED